MIIGAWTFCGRNSNTSPQMGLLFCNQIQQYSPFIIWNVAIMFNKVAEICVASLDDRLFFCVFTVIFMKSEPDFFEIFRTFSRYFGKHFEIFTKKNGNFRKHI